MIMRPHRSLDSVAFFKSSSTQAHVSVLVYGLTAAGVPIFNTLQLKFCNCYSIRLEQSESFGGNGNIVQIKYRNRDDYIKMNIKPVVFVIVIILIILMYLQSIYIPRGNRMFKTIKSKISHNLNFLVPKTFTTVEENKKKLPRFKASKAKILNGKISGYIAMEPSAKDMMKNEQVIERASSKSVLNLGHVGHKGTHRLRQSMIDTKCLFQSERIVPTADHSYCNYFSLSFLSSFSPGPAYPSHK